MNQKDIRWRQRYQNLDHACIMLRRSLELQDPSDTERAGIIQFFEVAFELSWKTLKDYLEAEGLPTASPREALKQGFQNGILADGQVWMQALEDRNLMAHTYDEATAKKVEALIRESYFPAIRQLHARLGEKL